MTIRMTRSMGLGLLSLSVTCIATTSGAQSLPGRVQGVVFDSTVMRPLTQARVSLISVRDSSVRLEVTSDAAGRYSLDGVAAGPWVAVAHHPRLDSLALRELMAPVDVRSGKRTQAGLSVPSARALAQRVCGANETLADSSGYIMGTLRRSAQGTAPTSGTVRVQWIDIVLTGTRPTRELMTVDVPTDSSGRFVACGVPANGTVLVRAASGVDSSGRISLRIPESGLRYRDLYLTGENGRLTGTVRGFGGRGVAFARVVMLANGREARTDSLGRFVLDDVPGGTQPIDVRAIGYDALDDAVDVVAGAPPVALELSRFMSLDTVRVRAQRSRIMSGRFAGYEARKKMGFGHFYDSDVLDRLNLLRISDFFATLPGIIMVTDQRGARIPTMRGATLAGRCSPVVLVDGFPFPPEAELDAFVPPMSVVAIEVYSSAFTPAELSRPFAPCGTIGIWTGARPPKPL